MEKMPSTLMTENHTTRADILMFGNEATKLDRHRPDSSSPGQKDSSFCKQDEKLESTRVEMGEVKRENERLKAILARIMKDYQSLQTQLSIMVPQELDKKPDLENTGIPPGAEESGLVSLSLGTSPRGSKEVEKTATSGKTEEDAPMNEGLALGLDCRFDRGGGASSEDDQWKYWRHEKSPDQEPKEEDAGGLPRPPSQALKTTSRPGDGEVPQQAQVIKKARVSLRARCDTPTMNDGCQWRKYGQKIEKGNPCPRAYYRCTVAPGCPVRKQVQRCADDMSILTTTYEGMHNHPLPMSATAMASTTSAAASMLMSGSSASRPESRPPAMAYSTADAASLGDLHFGLHDDSRQRRFCLPTWPSISSSPSHTTITLDLTSPSTSYSQSSQISRIPSNFPFSTGYSSTNFTFSPLDAHPISTPSSSRHLSFGTQKYDSHNQVITSFFGLGKQPQEPFYQPYLQNNITSPAAPVHKQTQNPLTDIVAEATKAIASDPIFQSALAEAIRSVMGGQGSQGAVETLLQNLRWGDQFSPLSTFTSSPGANGCSSSYLTRSASSNTNPQQGDLRSLHTSTAFCGPKGGSASPVDNTEHKK